MDTFKKNLLTGWSLMRVVRLAIGLLIAVQAFQTQSALAGFFAAFFLFQAITNTGCCGVSGCSVKPGEKNDQHPEDLAFEEIRRNNR